jgi:AcrR family transcriptional regulator
MSTVRKQRRAETRTMLLEAGLKLVAEQGLEFASLDQVADAAGFTKGAIYRQFRSKPAFILAIFEQFAAVARAGSGARQAPWFIPLTIQFASQALRDPLLRRRLAVVLAEAPDGTTSDGQILRALARVFPPPAA